MRNFHWSKLHRGNKKVNQLGGQDLFLCHCRCVCFLLKCKIYIPLDFSTLLLLLLLLLLLFWLGDQIHTALMAGGMLQGHTKMPWVRIHKVFHTKMMTPSPTIIYSHIYIYIYINFCTTACCGRNESVFDGVVIFLFKFFYLKMFLNNNFLKNLFLTPLKW